MDRAAMDWTVSSGPSCSGQTVRHHVNGVGLLDLVHHLKASGHQWSGHPLGGKREKARRG